MRYSEAVQYIEHQGWSSTKIGLERTEALLRFLGNPEKKLRFVHVTGSNGKGSTCAMVDAVLREAGFKTGLYTSPYIQQFGERIRVDGRNIDKRRLASITARIKTYADAIDDHPSQLELITAIEMQHIYYQSHDIVVLEVDVVES